MKLAKYFAAIAGLVVIALFVAWHSRDTLVRQVANKSLDAYGFEISDISLASLRDDSMTIQQLVLRHRSGMIISVSGFELPYGADNSGLTRYHAEVVRLESAASTGSGLIDFASSLDQVLQLPNQQPNVDISVASLRYDDWPEFRNLRWVSSVGQQAFAGSFDSVNLSAGITEVSASDYEIVMSLTSAHDAEDNLVVSATIESGATSYQVDGESDFSISALRLLIDAYLEAEQLPSVESGRDALTFSLQIPRQKPGEISIHLDAVRINPMILKLNTPESWQLRIDEVQGLNIQGAWPTNAWTTSVDSALMVVQRNDWPAISSELHNLSCEWPSNCSAQASFSTGFEETSVGSADTVRMISDISLQYDGNAINVEVSRDTTVAADQYRIGDLSFSQITAGLSEPAVVRVDETGWLLTGGGAAINLSSLHYDPVSLSPTRISIADFEATHKDTELFVRSNLTWSSDFLDWKKRQIFLPGLEGSVELRANSVSGEFTTTGLNREGNLQLQHDVATGQGQLTLKDATLSLSAKELSARMTPWELGFDVNAGSVSADMNVSWKPGREQWSFVGSSTTRFTDLAGAYGDVAFVGLSTVVTAKLNDKSGIAVDPVSMGIDLIEAGLPLESIATSFRVQPDPLVVNIDSLVMSAFGGSIVADPFVYEYGASENSVTLKVSSIDISKVLLAQEFDSIEVSGKVSGVLPVTLGQDKVTVSSGMLSGDEPGGVIRYQGGGGFGNSLQSSIALVQEALSNFHYQTLGSDVDFSADGDLKLAMRLEGRNPDMASNRPIVLNLNVENNVPKMLKSLQAARSVEGIIERRLQQQ